MAVETEQNTFLTPPEGGDNSPASVAVCEENLEALLRAVTAPAEPAPTMVAAVSVEPPVVAEPPALPPTATDPPVIDPPVIVDSPIEISSPTPVSESVASLPEWTESAAAPEPQHAAEPIVEVTAEVTAHESPASERSVHDGEAHAKEAAPEDAERPAESATREAAPVAESHQEVVSKLALLSSIKQRRAVAMRSDTGKSPLTEPEITGSASGQDAASTPVVQPAPAAEKQPVPDAPPPADQQSVRDKRLAQEDRPGAVAWRERAQPKVSEPPKIEKKDPPAKESQRQSATPARDDRASTPSLNRDPRSASITRTASTLFPSEVETSGKGKSFATSAPGLALIGGTVLALGLTAYLLLGHGSKPAANADKKAVTESVQTPRASAPPPALPAKSSAEKSSNVPPASATPRVEESKTPEKAPAKVEVAQSPKPAELPSQTTAVTTTTATTTPPPPAEINAVHTVARTFAPPAAGTRPIDTTIREAPPVLSTAAAPSIPSLSALPTGIAPPPPPSAPKTTVIRQISVAGNVQATRLVRKVTPAYPPLARATRVQGTVRFRAIIATDGQIKGLTLLSGAPPLVQGASDAVKQWRYQPTIANGEPVEVVTEIDVVFTL